VADTVDIWSPVFARLTDDQRALVQAAYMRLTTEAGTYWTDPDYGLDLSDYVNEDIDETRLQTIAVEVKAQLERDDRIATARVTATISGPLDSTALVLAIGVEPVEGEPVTFTVRFSDLQAEILEGFTFA
jgi:phage baseplate assembly protein W